MLNYYQNLLVHTYSQVPNKQVLWPPFGIHVPPPPVGIWAQKSPTNLKLVSYNSVVIRCLVFSSTTTLSLTAGFNFLPLAKDNISGVGWLWFVSKKRVDDWFQRIPAWMWNLKNLEYTQHKLWSFIQDLTKIRTHKYYAPLSTLGTFLMILKVIWIRKEVNLF